MNREAMLHPIIQHIDGALPTDLEIAAIESTPCLKCRRMFDPLQSVMFTRLDGDVVWWHRRQFDRAKCA